MRKALEANTLNLIANIVVAVIVIEGVVISLASLS